MVAVAAPADAHAELKSIDPAHRSVRNAAPKEVTLTFNQPVHRRFTIIRVTGPGGARAESGKPTVAREVVRQPLGALPGPGRFRVDYRTTSVDGHVISGTREFTYTPAAGGTTAAPQAPAAPPGTQEIGSRSSSGPSWGQVGLGALAVAVVLTPVVAMLRRRRGT